MDEWDRFEIGAHMARRVFFSFHYERDIWRVNQVRNHWITKPGSEDAGYWDAGLWEEAKKKGEEAINRMIDRALENTSVTVVLIGAQTSERQYVKYEIEQSYTRGNGLLGVYIHNLKDRNQLTDARGPNPFELFTVNANGQTLSQRVKTYDWVNDRGYEGFSDWVEKAARDAGR